MKTSLMESAPSRSRTHPNLPRRITHPDIPQGKEQVTLPINFSPSRSQTHPNLPQGKGQVTLPMNFSPLSVSPVGEMQGTPLRQKPGDAGYSVTVIDWWMQVSLAL